MTIVGVKVDRHEPNYTTSCVGCLRIVMADDGEPCRGLQPGLGEEIVYLILSLLHVKRSIEYIMVSVNLILLLTSCIHQIPPFGHSIFRNQFHNQT